MKTVVVVYTSMGGLVNNMKTLLKEALPDFRIVNIADDSLINEVIAAEYLTDGVKTRLFKYFDAAASLKPDLIVSACSSVGALAEEYNASSDVPVLRIDHAMILRALQSGKRIGILAAHGTTMEPTKDYISRQCKKEGREVEVLGLVAEGAYQANVRGEKDLYNKLLLDAAGQMKGKVDAVLLAQGSMASMEQPIHELLGVPVLSSPKLCCEEVVKIVRGE